jgi:uncharacterized protein YbcC (UPF0753/DUF2309 family)
MASNPADLSRIIEHAAHLLPAQGPISIFIHHNTLHAFEDLPFEMAVERAAVTFRCEPYLAESRYRDKLAVGRILAKDVEAIIAEELGSRASETVGGVGARRDLWRAIVLHGVPAAGGRELDWVLGDTDGLLRFRRDLPAAARALTSAARDGEDPRGDEQRVVGLLWRACVDAVARTEAPPVRSAAEPIRHADWLREACQVDVDGWFHPSLIRFLAAYLDQGLAHWRVPLRTLGIHGSFLEIFGTKMAAQAGRWARTLSRVIRDDRRSHQHALDSIAHSLDELGVPEHEYEAYLIAELLALRGWAGIVRQIEERPDRVPARDLTITLRGYLAVRLLFERAALEEAARQVGFTGPLTEFREWLRQRGTRQPVVPTVTERAWQLFHVAQLHGLDAPMVDQWTAPQIADLETELRDLDGVRCRRILHLAFERTIRQRLYGALMQHPAAPEAQSPAFQAVFCLDEREESFRRHLEEAEPACETFSTAGFFNIAMYYQGPTDAHPRPLCPVVIRPDHYIAEVEAEGDRLGARTRRLHRRTAGFLGYNVHIGSRRPIRGALLMTAFGWLALLPLVLRVVFPWLSSHWHRARRTSMAATQTRLQIDRVDRVPPLGAYSGYTVHEMASIVRRVLEDTGLSNRLAPLVLVVGHGSISLNNPHESAHDCGACGGGRGGPNARAFAEMANDVRVRALLASEGLTIDARTWFVGAQRNTCSNEVTFFDEDLVPDEVGPLFARAKDAIDTARRREAHERCRRFDNVPRWYPSLAALAHVEGRADDLAQPRPEYGHATNAFCVIGRRQRTRGLFLDRRAFLVSYDPARDDEGGILARVMGAVVPVVAGINLEYYFSYVDPAGYGCGTKLPHNVTSLLGVMDGAQSDLRTGLPWQMVEIHEPARLAIVVEAPHDRVLRVLRHDSNIDRLVRNRWIWLACLDPESGAVVELAADSFRPQTIDQPLPVVRGDSATWYQGKRGFVAPASIVPAGSGAAGASA